MGSRSCPNQTKLDIEYPFCNYSLKQRNFCYSLRRKKFGIPYGNLRIFRINCYYWILRKGLFHRFKELSKSNQTRYGVSPMYLETKTNIICHRLPRKKMWFSYGNLRISPLVNFKDSVFHRIKELSKSNQTWYGVSPMYLESKTKRIFAIACVAKFGFSYGNLRLFRMNSSYWILKIGLFHWVNELSKPKQTRYGVSPIYLETKTKKNCHRLPRKKIGFHTEICEFHH